MPPGATLDRPKPTFPDGFVQSDEIFGVTCEFIDAEKLGTKKKGRLGRLIWEFQTADVINRNRRIYPAAVVAIAVQELQTRIGKNVVFGNLDHPSIFDFDSLFVKLGDAAVKISEVTMTTQTNVRVVADILDNRDGKQLISVLEVEGNPGVSQRAVARWREPNEEEIAKFKIPEDQAEFVDVAESLRLITYDVVSEPGFADADGAKVTEHRNGAAGMNLDQLKKDHPSLYSAVIAEGKASGRAEIEAQVNDRIKAAVDSEKPKIVEEAVKPFQEKVDAAEKAKQKALETLTAVKPVMVELGIVNEQITDAQAASKVATAEAKVATLETEKQALETKLDEANKKLAEVGKRERVRSCLEAVDKVYKDHPAHDHILTQLAPRNLEDQNVALEAAKQIAAFIESVNPAMKPGAPKSDDTNPGNSFDGSNMLSGLLKSNPANPAGTPAPANDALNGLAAGVFGGGSLGF